MVSGHILPFEGQLPTIHPTAFIAPTAAVIGRVEIGEGASIWYHCVLRGDTNFIKVGARSNVQDGTIVHVARDGAAAIIGDDVTIGHAAIIHACTLENRAFIGMGAVVMDDCVVEEGGMLAAGSVLPPGKRIGRGELWRGNPAVKVRDLSEEQSAAFARNTAHYVELGGRHIASLEAARPADRDSP